jgi:cell division protein FtsW
VKLRRPKGGTPSEKQGKQAKRARRQPKEIVAKPSTFYLLVGIVGVLVVIGLVMVLSASSVQSQREYGSTWSYFLRQSIWTVFSVIACMVMARIDYRRWRPLIPVLLAGSFVLLVVVLVPGIGLQVNGARSWIGRGMFRMQPSELVKLALLLFCADILARRHNRMDEARLTLVPVLVVVGVTALLMMLQPDLGSTMVMGAIVFSVLFVAGVPLGRLTGVFTVGSAGALVLALAKPYRRNRLLAFLDPSKDPANTGYQINQSLMGVASGGFFGVGLGESRAKWGFLPNAYSDFIFAIIAEELGLLGALLVVGLFLAFGVVGIRAALRAPDRFGMFVAAGITAWVLAQAFVNIGGVVGILPITGLTLPYVSYGGTSLLVMMSATGLLLNIAANGGPQPKAPPVKGRPPQQRSTRHPAMAGR